MSFAYANVLVLLVYAVATASRLRRGLGTDAGDAPRWIAGAGALLHVAVFIAEYASGLLPGFGESMSAAALGVVLVFVAVGRDRLASLGVVMLPVGVLLHGASFLAPGSTVVALRELGGAPTPLWWLPVHLGLVFAGFAGLLLELALAALQAVVATRLKSKKFTEVSALPPLDAVVRVQQRALVFALVSLGAGIATGAVGAYADLGGHAWLVDVKVLVSAALWSFYASLLWWRARRGWLGRHVLVQSAVGFLAQVLSFVLLPFIASGFHAHGG